MIFLIFAMFLLLPVGVLFLVISVGNVIYGDVFIGLGSLVVCVGCAGALFYLVKKYLE